jgi:hypothetical protein
MADLLLTEQIFLNALHEGRNFAASRRDASES